MPHLKPFYVVEPSSWWLTDMLNMPTRKEDATRGLHNPSPEQVRQWVLTELVESYHYPRQWVGTRIVPASQVSAEFDLPGSVDLCILTQWGKPFIYVSISAPKTDPEPRLRKHLLALPDTALGMSTDSSPERTRFVRKRVGADKFDYVVDIDPYSAKGALSPQFLAIASHAPPPDAPAVEFDARPLVPLDERFEDVFFEAHSHIRDIDGMHADEALDELSKVIYAKLYDEEHPDDVGRPQMQTWLYGCVEEFAASVRHIYRTATEYDQRVFGLRIPGYERSRGVFSLSIRLSNPALAKVAETLQDYDLGNSGTDVKGRAFQRVVAPVIRAGMGQYFTPDPVVRFAVWVAAPSVNDLILDPFCGSAHFLTASLQHVREETGDASGKPFHEFAFGKLHGIEKSDRMVRIAMTDMRLQGDGHSNIRCTDALLAFDNYPDLQPESFDIVLTNPPFGSLLGRDALRRLGAFALASGRSAVPLEVIGLERCIQFLRPGGRLGIVLPDGLLANRNAAYVRRWLQEQVKVRGIVSLPIETFQPFGAAIKTSLLFARKWRPGERRETDYPVFLARVDNIGYEATGRQRDSGELEEVADQFLSFLRREGW